METYDFKVKWCPFCDQGWVCIEKQKGSSILILVCHECCAEWKDPTNVTIDSCAETQTLLMEHPTADEIKQYDWEQYILRE